jgi:hypothetical protein
LSGAASEPRKLVQWPFVGVVVLLLVLIVLTPNLINAGGPSAGSLETQAVLVVDRVTGSNVTHFYVHGLGTARYVSISVALARPALWPAPARASLLNWTNVSFDTQTLGVTVRTTADPVGVNVTATYLDPAGVRVVYVGVYVVHGIGTTIFVARIPSDPVGLASSPIGGPPLSLLLGTTPSGSGP